MKKKRSLRKKLLWAGVAAAALFGALAGVAWHLSKRFEPFVRDQLVEYLRARFDGDVELGSLDVSMPIRDPLAALLRKGKGARVRVKAGHILLRHRGRTDIPPLLVIRQLDFQMDLSTLLEKPARVQHVKLEGFELTIPPKGERPDFGGAPAAGRPPAAASEPTVIIDAVDLDGMKLAILPRDRAKAPLEFEMATLRLESAGPGVPMRYETVMTNARPPGLIQCKGTFGPYVSGEPGESPLTGSYVFTDADLGVFQAIAGKLSSKGEFKGKLNEIIVDGETHTPDFQLKAVKNPVPLRTKFHAIVDGTNGNTMLQPVEATLGASRMTCRGAVARNKDETKKTIDFRVVVNRGRVEDFLRLAVKGPKPPLEGGTKMNFRMRVPPGPGKVASRLVLDGTFSLDAATFTSDTVQEKIDDLSRRAQGRPAAEEIQRVPSDFAGAFRMKGGQLDLSRLVFAIPGADVALRGGYHIESEELDFRGVVKTKARLSQMAKSRWKRIVLKPVDPFFAKGGAGAVFRIAITGTRSEPHFGLDKSKPEEQKATNAARRSNTR
ncbi:MAG: hypothetical protein KIT09_05285 [Bryobacteraceae bacterium]|nr:hypothetical protein [Bryobacteraceae bacterium]